MNDTVSRGALRDLYDRSAPVASVYVDVRVTGEQDVLPRWHALAAELARQGADLRLVTLVRDNVLAAVPGAGTLVVFTSGSDVLLAADLPGCTQPDVARYDLLPHVLPVLEWLQCRPPHVVAVVDRTGSDVTLVPGGAAAPVQWAVSGPDDEIERNAPGGRAQARYQHRAEDSWEHNAVRVAEEIVPILRRNAVPLLVLSGDIRAVQFLEKHLSGSLKHDLVIRHVSGGRSPDGADRLRAEQVADDVACTVAARTASLLAELDEERRPGGRAVEGAEATLDALAQGRVQVLLIGPDEPGSVRSAWFGPVGTDVAADPATLERRGVRPLRGRLVDAAVRAALLTRADVRVLQPGGDVPQDGIGALCRF